MKTYRVKDMLPRRWQANDKLSEDVILYTDSGTITGYFSYTEKMFIDRSYDHTPIDNLLDCLWEYYTEQSDSDIDRVCGIPVEPRTN